MSDETENGPDFSFVPETFRTEDGKPDGGAFRSAYDELAAAKAIADEAAAAFPKTADEYPFAVPEDLKDLLPEGFEPPEDFKLELTDDPDLPSLKALLHKHKVPPAAAEELANMLAAREIRGLHEAGKAHHEELQKLGANAQSRIDAVKRSVGAKVPQAEADALMADLTSADAIRAMEKVLTSGAPRPHTAASEQTADLSKMTPLQKIEHGYAQRARS